MERSNVQSGLMVRSADGTPLGRVIQCDAERFTVGAGGFFDDAYDAPYEEILAFKRGEIYLNRHDEQLVHERSRIPAVGAATGYALEGEREIEQEIAGGNYHNALENELQ